MRTWGSRIVLAVVVAIALIPASANGQPASLLHDTVLLARRSKDTSRMRQYLWAVLGPRAMLRTVAVAGIDQLRDVPEEWDDARGGHRRRLESAAGRFAIQTTVTHGLAAAAHRPVSYVPCDCEGTGRRMRHALLGAVTEVAPTGGRTLAWPRIAGVYAGTFVQLAWLPRSVRARDALRSGTMIIAASTIPNLVQELFRARRNTSPATAQTAMGMRPDLSGRWALNAQQSEDAKAKLDSMQAAQGAETRWRHMLGMFGANREDVEDARAYLLATPQSFDLSQRGDSITFRYGDGRVRTLIADGTNARVERQDTHTKWDGEVLLSEISFGPAKVTETHELSSATSQLIVTTTMAVRGHRVSVRRLYDRAP